MDGSSRSKVVKDGSSAGIQDLKSLLSDPNEGLFLSFYGDSIEFFCDLKDNEKKQSLESLVFAYGGTAISKYEDITAWTVIIVDQGPEIHPKCPLFSTSYIIDCVSTNTLLDITDYALLKNTYSVETTFMDVIFWRKKEFPRSLNVLKCTSYKHSQLNPNEGFCKTRNSEQSSSSSDHSVQVKYDNSHKELSTCYSMSELSTCTQNYRKSSNVVSKSTREPYSMSEKEAILKFLVARGKYDNLKGPNIWRTMEVRNVCPKRTYQSLKEHFAKALVHQLDRFPFLTENQKARFREGFPVARARK